MDPGEGCIKAIRQKLLTSINQSGWSLKKQLRKLI